MEMGLALASREAKAATLERRWCEEKPLIMWEKSLLLRELRSSNKNYLVARKNGKSCLDLSRSITTFLLENMVSEGCNFLVGFKGGDTTFNRGRGKWVVACMVSPLCEWKWAIVEQMAWGMWVWVQPWMEKCVSWSKMWGRASTWSYYVACRGVRCCSIAWPSVEE